MARDRAAALLLVLALGAGAWWILRRQGAAQGQGGELGISWPDISWPEISWPALELPDLGTLGVQLQAAAGAVQDAAEAVVTAVTPGPWAPPSRAAPYLPAIAAAELRYGIPQNMLARLLYQESRYREDIISGRTASSAGALGIAQFMPGTARDLGVDPLMPDQAIDGAGRYLAQLYAQTGSWRDALGAYNWGIGNVKRKGLAGAPLETRNYVEQITGDIGYV